jgi:hypothetical protein
MHRRLEVACTERHADRVLVGQRLVFVVLVREEESVIRGMGEHEPVLGRSRAALEEEPCDDDRRKAWDRP